MISNNEIGTRIKEEREKLGLTLQDIAESIGVARSTIQRYENGNINNIKLPVIAAIAKVLKINSAWLVGKSEVKYEDSIPQFGNIFSIEKRKIPMLGSIACGKPILANQEFESYIEVGSDIKADFCLRAKGDSMINARIFDSDIIFIREQPDVEDGEIAAVIIDNEATLKRVYKMPGRLQLRAENPNYEPLNFEGEKLNEIKILGKAIAFQSDIK